jgi:hypothetical protein
METLIVYPKNEAQETALKAIFKALDIPFDKKKTGKSPYNPEFVKKIEESREQIKAGKGVRIKVEDLWK